MLKQSMHYALPWLLLSALFLARPLYAGEWAGTMATTDGIVHVQNPEEPIEAEKKAHVDRLWTIGGDSESDDELFGVIVEILVDPNGNTYLLDIQLSRVTVFGPDGAFVRSFGRSGEGPGEFQTPGGMCFLPDDKLAVLQMMPARVVVFTLAGEPLPDLAVPEGGAFAPIQKLVSAGESIIMARQATSFSGGKISVEGQLLRVNAEGEIQATLWKRSQEMDPAHMVVGSRSQEILPPWAVDRDGNVYISPSYDDYRIDVIGSDGALTKTIHRDGYESRRYTDEEIAKRKDAMSNFPMQMGNIQIEIDPMDRDIHSLEIRDNGELWVVSSRSNPGENTGALGVFEVFDRDGRYVHNRRVMLDYDAEQDTQFSRGAHVYVVAGGQSALQGMLSGLGITKTSDTADDELEPPAIVCYRVGNDE